MPPSDQEPRYQLIDSNGNVVGSLFGDGSGNVVIADETDTQTTFDPDGITTPALKASEVTLGATGIRSAVLEGSDGSQQIGDSLGVSSVVGFLLVTKNSSNTASAIYSLDGGAAEVSEIGDPEGEFGTTQGQSAVNIYHDGSNYIIEITDDTFSAKYTYIGS